MGLDRRDFFKAVAAGSVSAMGANVARSHAAKGDCPLIRPSSSVGDVPDFDGRSLVNKERAYEVMDRENLEGIVALSPVNVFYLGNFLSIETLKLRAIPSFAVMPRDPQKPTVLVVSSSDVWSLANNDREYPEIIPYTAPSGWEAYQDSSLWGSEPEARGSFLNRLDTPSPDVLTDVERGWMEFHRRVEGATSATPEWGLVNALRESGIEKGRIAVDDMRVSVILESLGYTKPVCVPGDNTFRKIRMIKSEVELTHMRRAALINQRACEAMMSRIERGMRKPELDNLFMLEAAQRGSHGVWIVTGNIGGLHDGEVIEGRPMMIDSVSHNNFYHGDFGRTFVLGEPRDDVVKRTQILNAGHKAALEAIKPGVKYSDVRAAAQSAMRKTGQISSAALVGVNPHSVGLQHTDQPYRDGLPFVVHDDLLFEENMTLTVDCATLEVGWGAAHLEDLVRVTKDGVEPLGDANGALVTVG